MERRDFIKNNTLMAGAALAPGFNFRILNKPSSKHEVIIGHNDFRYKVNANWSQADPANIPVNDCHEMVQDSQGRIILLTNETKNNLIFYDKSGKVLKAFGNDFPGAHGLTLVDENGEEFLFITDYRKHEVYKTTLDGRVVMTLTYPLESGKYGSAKQYKPTETSIGPNGDIYIVDGYGEQFVLQYDYYGNFIRSFGGAGWMWKELLAKRYPDNIDFNNDKNKVESHLNNAHGIAIDYRDTENPVLLVTSRMDQVIKRFTLDGRFLSNIEIPGAFVCRPVINGENIYAAVLRCERPTRDRTGFVTILDKNNKVVSNPGGTEPVYEHGYLGQVEQVPNSFFIHPHDVCVDEDLNLYVPQWNSGKTYPVKLERV